MRRTVEKERGLGRGEAGLRSMVLGRDLCLATAVALASLGLYTATLAPGLTGEDSGELITAAHTLGIPHPPGYPLWCLLARLSAVVLPFGGVAWSVNFLSALAAAATVFVVTLVARELGATRVAAVGAGALAAVARDFWSQAVIAEVYTLATFFLLGLIWVALRARNSRNAGLLGVFAGLFGLALTNHHSIAAMGGLPRTLLDSGGDACCESMASGFRRGMSVRGGTPPLFVPPVAVSDRSVSRLGESRNVGESSRSCDARAVRLEGRERSALRWPLHAAARCCREVRVRTMDADRPGFGGVGRRVAVAESPFDLRDARCFDRDCDRRNRLVPQLTHRARASRKRTVRSTWRRGR